MILRLLYYSMIGIVSDIHGNITAIRAVLEDMEDVDCIVCCGDIVGYGPKPRECVQLIKDNSDIVISGNHDNMVVGSGNYNSNSAREGIKHARKQLYNDDFRWLENLQDSRVEEIAGLDFRIVHASPSGGINHIYEDQLEDAFSEYFDTDVFLYGHTHIPVNKFIDGCLVINPGSVGQPRDGDSRASYATIDPDNLEAEIHRVEYNIDQTRDNIEDYSLPSRTAERLYEGN